MRRRNCFVVGLILDSLEHTDTALFLKLFKLSKLLNPVELTLDLIARECLVLKARKNRPNSRIIQHRRHKSKIKSMRIYMKIVAYNRYLALNLIPMTIKTKYLAKYRPYWSHKNGKISCNKIFQRCNKVQLIKTSFSLSSCLRCLNDWYFICTNDNVWWCKST